MLSACTPPASTAAEVGGTRITEASVDAVIDNCAAVGLPLVDQANSRGGVVFSMAAAEYARQPGAFGDARPEPELVDELLAGSLPTNVLANDECNAFLAGTTTFNVALEGMQASMDPDAFNDELTDIVTSFNLNPRYGRVKMQEGGVARIESGSLSATPGV